MFIFFVSVRIFSANKQTLQISLFAFLFFVQFYVSLPILLLGSINSNLNFKFIYATFHLLQAKSFETVHPNSPSANNKFRFHFIILNNFPLQFLQKGNVFLLPQVNFCFLRTLF